MKKTLVALAAIAAVGAASAQVSVYGQLDVGVNNTSAGGTVVGISGLQTSRFGVKAEQKVGGLTVSAVLEGEIGAGTAVFKGFDRTSTIGIGGSFGTVTLGNQWTPFDNAVWTTDSTEYSKFTPLAAGLWNTDGGNTGMGNAKNSIQYTTPDIGGFQFIVLTAPNVSDSMTNKAGLALAKDYSGIGLNYTKGPLVINFATQNFSAPGAPSSSSKVIAVNYNVGAANLYGGLVNSDGGAGSTESGFVIGAKVPFGADSVSVGYASNKTSSAGKDSTVGAWSAQYVKAIGTSAQAYIGIQSVDSVNKTGAGLRVNF